MLKTTSLALVLFCAATINYQSVSAQTAVVKQSSLAANTTTSKAVASTSTTSGKKSDAKRGKSKPINPDKAASLKSDKASTVKSDKPSTAKSNKSATANSDKVATAKSGKAATAKSDKAITAKSNKSSTVKSEKAVSVKSDKTGITKPATDKSNKSASTKSGKPATATSQKEESTKPDKVSTTKTNAATTTTTKIADKKSDQSRQYSAAQQLTPGKTASVDNQTASQSHASVTGISDNRSSATSYNIVETNATVAAVNLLRDKQALSNLSRPPVTFYTPKLVDVTEQTIRLGGGKKEELMFGFAAGDKIIFNFQEADGKDVKEVEIIEYPTMSRFSEYKTSRIKNKEILVNQQSVFIFRMKNSLLAKRICRLKIQRLPANQAAENFNSSVSWVTKQDTVWTSYTTDVVIGYDTVMVPRTKRVLVRSEIEEQILADQTERVNAKPKLENRSTIVLSLPVGNRSAYKTSKVIRWAFWIGVDEDGKRAWQQDLRAVRSRNTDYYSPLGIYANGGLANLTLPKSGQNINYFLADQANRDLFVQKQPFRSIHEGKGSGGYRKFNVSNQNLSNQNQGVYYLCFENSNLLGYADVHVKVIALVEKSFFEDQAYEEHVVTPITERQIKQQPNIRNITLPVTGI